jgi:DNA-binding NtrC family response regulator
MIDPQNTEQEQGKATGENTVLFVDDDDQLRRVYARLFAGTALEIHLAADAQEAMTLIQAQSFALVISDFFMPGLDGIRFLEKVGEEQPHAVRILISGHALEIGDSGVEVDPGLFCVVRKPWGIAELLATVQQALERFRASDR